MQACGGANLPLDCAPRPAPQGALRRGARVVDRGGLENRCAREGTQGSNPCLSANISMRTDEMGLTRPEIPQLPRRFADGVQTPKTAEYAKIGL